MGNARVGRWPARAFTLAVSLLAVVALLAPAAASAHPALIQASPAAGLVAPEAPKAIELSLSEAAVPDGSQIELSQLAGDPVPLGDLRTREGGTTLLAEPLKTLPEGVYEVRWSALGADGHTVGGRFAFGVAGPKGENPDDVQALVAYGSRGGSGDQSANAEGAFSVIARWLGITAAAFLFGGWVLLLLLERNRVACGITDAQLAEGRSRWRTLAPPVWLLALMAASAAVLFAATVGAGSQIDLKTALDTASGRAAFVQLALLVVISPVLLFLGRWPRLRDATLAAGGLGVLVTDALIGHVQTITDGKGLAVFAQVLHSVSAGIWFGGLLALLVVAGRASSNNRPELGAAARAFAPVAAATLVVSVVTGVLAAFREIDDIFFLRWSGYGNVVLIKAGLVLLAAVAAGIATLRARRSGRSHSGRALGIEAGILALVVVFAAVLSGLVPGRGQALPAGRGNLLPGPAIASALADGGPMRVTLAPARSGDNVLSAVQEPAPGKQVVPNTKAVSAELTCQCSGQTVDAKLVSGPGDVWSTDVTLPADGTWFARLDVDGKEATAMALNVGVPEARGPDPLQVLSVADLSGKGAASCRSHLLGVELAVGRMNALGGFDDGRKVALTALDDGGSAERAAELAKSAIDSGDVLALVGACGEGAEGAVKAASAAGVPSIVADPTVPIVNADNVFRSAGDPYAEGFSDAQYIESTVATAQTSAIVRAVETGTPENTRLLDGLRDGLAKSKYELDTLKPSEIDADPPQLKSTLDESNAAAVVVDGDAQVLAARFRALGSERLDFATAPIIASTAAYSEDMVRRSGAIGRIGALQGPAEIAPDTTVGATYARAVPTLFPGELPSLEGLRGYTAGLALSYALNDGTDPQQVIDRLIRPSAFADSLLSPWRSDARSLGSQRFEFLKPSFLPPTLIPTSAGGEAQSGTFFTDGTWARTNTDTLGPPLEQPVPPLDDGG